MNNSVAIIILIGILAAIGLFLGLILSAYVEFQPVTDINKSTGGSFENQWIKFEYPPDLIIMDGSTNESIVIAIYNGSVSLENQIGVINDYTSSYESEAQILYLKGSFDSNSEIQVNYEHNSLFWELKGMNISELEKTTISGKKSVILNQTDSNKKNPAAIILYSDNKHLTVSFLDIKDQSAFDKIISTFVIK